MQLYLVKDRKHIEPGVNNKINKKQDTHIKDVWIRCKKPNKINLKKLRKKKIEEDTGHDRLVEHQEEFAADVKGI